MGTIVSGADSSRLYELAVATVCFRALKGKTSSQRDLYRALSMHRYYPNHEAMLRDIMMWLPSSRYVQVAGTNRSGWGLLTATAAGKAFYEPLVGVFEDRAMRRRAKPKSKKSADDAFLDDLFKDTKF